LALTEHLALAHGAKSRVGFDAVEALLSLGWPLNVRELRSLSRLHLALHGEAPLDRAALRMAKPEVFEQPPVFEELPASPGFGTAAPPRSMDSLEGALHRTGGNVVEAARFLGISRATFYREARKHALDLTNYRRPSGKSGTHWLPPSALELTKGTSSVG
jgi:transcriptional regulator of acetoin/glycerol metabolism